MSKLLIDESPLLVLPSLAVAIGLNEAMVLQQLHWLSQQSKNMRVSDGWVQQALAEWARDKFKFWSYDTFKRTVKKLKDDGLIEVETVPLAGGQGGARREARIRVNHDKLVELELQVARSGQIAPTSTTQNASISGGKLPRPRTDLRERDLKETPLSPPRGGRGRAASVSRRARDRAQASAPAVVEACPQVVAIDAAQMWATASAKLKLKVPDYAFETWLVPCHAHGVEDGTLDLGCPTPIHGWVRQRFGHAIAEALGGRVKLYACSGAMGAESEPGEIRAEHGESEATG